MDSVPKFRETDPEACLAAAVESIRSSAREAEKDSTEHDHGTYGGAEGREEEGDGQAGSGGAGVQARPFSQLSGNRDVVGTPGCES